MNEELKNEQLAAISEMRDMMQRSSRFLSLSGLAGILVGCVAILGVGVAYYLLEMPFGSTGYLMYLEKALKSNEATLKNIIFICVTV